MTELDKDALEAAAKAIDPVAFGDLYDDEPKIIQDRVIAKRLAALATARAAIRAYLDAADDWRPIETAPKDGTDVLVSRRDKDGFEWFAVAQWWVRAWAFMSGRPGDMPALIGFTPTHWRPLPSPPKEG